MKFNAIEKEIIYLLAIKGLIDEMVNYEMILLLGESPSSEIRFKTMTHQKFFNILLVDFLSRSDTRIIGETQPYLQALTSVCANPHFNEHDSVNSLKDSTKAFTDWLDKEITVEKLWLPSIELETNLSIRRREFIKICGNISKHNFTRLSGVTRELIEIFLRNKIKLGDIDALAIISDFYDWFHRDIFNYHSSAIAEFLNNIRWGLYEYLLPEFQHSIVFENDEHPKKYHYTYPSEVDNRFAKECYWDLMNEIRSKPYMNKFQVTRYLKMRY